MAAVICGDGPKYSFHAVLAGSSDPNSDELNSSVSSGMVSNNQLFRSINFLSLDAGICSIRLIQQLSRCCCIAPNVVFDVVILLLHRRCCSRSKLLTRTLRPPGPHLGTYTFRALGWSVSNEWELFLCTFVYLFAQIYAPHIRFTTLRKLTALMAKTG